MSSIQTFTNRMFYPLSPRGDNVVLEDIAHALSMKCRYTGHTRKFYSVAQHAVLVSRLIYKMRDDPFLAFQGLHHDDTEFALPDVASPIKDDIVGFRDIENRLHDVIADAIGLPHEFHPIVKRADRILLIAEQKALMPPKPSTEDKYRTCPLAQTIKIRPVNDRKAKRLFLKEHYFLMRKMREAAEPRKESVLSKMLRFCLGGACA